MITLDNFIGNRDLITLLKISVEAAKKSNSALPHVLLEGPAGTGKTTLAEVVAREFSANVIPITPLSVKKTEDIRRLFYRMPGDGYSAQGEIVGTIKPQVLFCDEIHQLPLSAQENLGIAMQDWRLPVQVKGRNRFEWVPRFTLIGATTIAGKLSKPFLDRFKIHGEFQTYSFEEALEITKLQAGILSVNLAPGVAEEVAKRCRGVARYIVRFLERLRDVALVSNREVVSLPLTIRVFSELLRIDERGLTTTDLKILKALASQDRPVGVELLASITNEDGKTLAQVCEPFLLQEGFIARGKTGRIITEAGMRYLAEGKHLLEGESTPANRMLEGS